MKRLGLGVVLSCLVAAPAVAHVPAEINTTLFPGTGREETLRTEHHGSAAYTHWMLGQVHMQNGNEDATIASIERALELEPDNEYATRMLERVKAAE